MPREAIYPSFFTKALSTLCIREIFSISKLTRYKSVKVFTASHPADFITRFCRSKFRTSFRKAYLCEHFNSHKPCQNDVYTFDDSTINSHLQEITDSLGCLLHVGGLVQNVCVFYQFCKLLPGAYVCPRHALRLNAYRHGEHVLLHVTSIQGSGSRKLHHK